MKTKTAAKVTLAGALSGLLGFGVGELPKALKEDSYRALVDATRCSEQLGEEAMNVVVLPNNCEAFNFNNHVESVQVFNNHSDDIGVREEQTTYVLPSAEDFLNSESARIATASEEMKMNLNPATAIVFGLAGIAYGVLDTRRKTPNPPRPQ